MKVKTTLKLTIIFVIILLFSLSAFGTHQPEVKTPKYTLGTTSHNGMSSLGGGGAQGYSVNQGRNISISLEVRATTADKLKNVVFFCDLPAPGITCNFTPAQCTVATASVCTTQLIISTSKNTTSAVHYLPVKAYVVTMSQTSFSGVPTVLSLPLTISRMDSGIVGGTSGPTLQFRGAVGNTTVRRGSSTTLVITAQTTTLSRNTASNVFTSYVGFSCWAGNPSMVCTFSPAICEPNYSTNNCTTTATVYASPLARTGIYNLGISAYHSTPPFGAEMVTLRRSFNVT
ncbi:TPA: hypothetical protein HA241_04260 [Candidatus Woesearchaeota archaeon]|nr:hypothetical protein [Candidatus Woesearchaeota archaeon]